MKILITGAAGFVGQLLAKELLKDHSNKLILADVVTPPIPAAALYPKNVKTLKADLSTGAKDVVSEDLDAAYVFHGIMSAGSEANFELGMKVNIDATRNLLEEFRKTCPGVRMIYASGGAVYGQPMPEVVDDSVTPTPESSYGAQKYICEILINDYTRRGFLDGISLRFPSITVRPGLPTAAASSFLSGMIREPMNGIECVIPIEDRAFPNWVFSPRILVANLIHALTMDTSKLPPHRRAINTPGIQCTIQDMMDALARVGGADKLKLLKEKDDPSILPILKSWAIRYDNTQAIELGFKRDTDFVQAARDYRESFSS